MLGSERSREPRQAWKSKKKEEKNKLGNKEKKGKVRNVRTGKAN